MEPHDREIHSAAEPDLPEPIRPPEGMSSSDDSATSPALREIHKKAKRPRRRWTRWLIGLGAAITLFVLMLPLLLRWGVQWWLRSQGLSTAVVKELDFNLFTGRLSARSIFSVKTKDNRLHVGETDVQLNWGSLIRRRISISGFALRDVTLDVIRDADGSINVGGLIFKAGEKAEAKPEEEKPGKPWQFRIGAIDLDDVRVDYRDGDFRADLLVRDLHVDPLDNALPNTPTPFELVLTLNDGNIALKGATAPFSGDRAVTTTLNVSRFALAWLGPILREHEITRIGGEINANATLSLALKPAPAGALVGYDGKLEVRDFTLGMPAADVRQVTVGWDGKLGFSGGAIDADGSLKVDRLALSLPGAGMQIDQREMSWQGGIARSGGPNPLLKVKGTLAAAELKITDLKQPLPLLALGQLQGEIRSLEMRQAADGKISLNHDAAIQLKEIELEAATQRVSLAQGELAWDGKGTVGEHGSDALALQGELSGAGTRFSQAGEPGVQATLEHFKLSETQVNLAGGAQRFAYAGGIELGALEGSVATPAMRFSQGGLSWNGKASRGESGAIDADGRLAAREIKFMQEATTGTRAQLGELEINLERARADPAIEVGATIRLAALQADLGGPGLVVRNDEIRWQGQARRSADGKTASLNGAIATGKLAVDDRISSSALLRLGKAEITMNPAGIGETTAGQALQYDGRITLNDLESELKPQGYFIAQQALAWEGSVLRPLATSGTTTVAGILELKGTRARETKAEGLSAEMESASVDVRPLTLQSAAGGQQIQVASEIKLGGIKADVPQSGMNFSQERIEWQGSTRLVTSAPRDARVEGDFAAGKLRVGDRRLKRELVRWDQLNVRGIRLAGVEEIGFGELRLNGARGLQRAPSQNERREATGYIAALENLIVENLKMHGQRVEIDAVRLRGVNSWNVRLPDGQLEMAAWLERGDTATTTTVAVAESSGTLGVATAATPTTTTEQGATSNPLTVRVGRVELEGENRFLFRDETFTPAFEIMVAPFSFSVVKLDTGNVDQLSEVALRAQVGDFSDFSLMGELTPMKPIPDLQIRARIDSIHLDPATPYTARYIGQRLERGALNSQFDIRIQQGKLDSKNEILLRELEFASLRQDERDSMTQSLGLPLNLALSLLKDSKGDIQLSIPVQGELDNPKVGIIRPVLKTIFNAMLDTIRGNILRTFSPLGMVMEALPGGRSAVKFQPIAFEPGSSMLVADSMSLLGTMADIMNDRPKIKVRLTGVTTFGDRLALAQDAAKWAGEPGDSTVADLPVSTGTLASAPPTSGTESIAAAPQPMAGAAATTETTMTIQASRVPIAKLQELASERADLVKNYLVTRGGIAAERIGLAEPQVDDAISSRPRVEIGF